MGEDVGMKGFAYAPMYLADESCLTHYDQKCAKIPNDDIYADWDEAMWGAKGRNDLETMKAFGANAIRMYGLDPRWSKKKFFDNVLKLGMKVVTGLSNYPYNQAKTNCYLNNNFDCHDAIESYWSQVLNTSEFAKEGYYHNAIDVITIMNEPNWADGNHHPPGDDYVKAMLTAFDGVISAEKKAGIRAWKNGQLPRLTVTWAEDQMCPKLAGSPCAPGLGGMTAFQKAVHNPAAFGYTLKNSDLAAIFQKRWVNSMNVFQQSSDLDKLFLQNVMSVPGVKDTPIYIGEYAPAQPKSATDPGYKASDLLAGLQKINSKSGDWSKVFGTNFFSFQRAYEKPGYNAWFGTFGMTSAATWTITIPDGTWPTYKVNCLTLVHEDIAQAIASAYGGKVPAVTCPSGDLVIV